MRSSLQNDMEVTCMQTKVENKSNRIQNTKVITYTQNKVEIMSNSIKNTVVNHLHEKEGKDQVQLNPEHHKVHLQGEEGKD